MILGGNGAGKSTLFTRTLSQPVKLSVLEEDVTAYHREGYDLGLESPRSQDGDSLA